MADDPQSVPLPPHGTQPGARPGPQPAAEGRTVRYRVRRAPNIAAFLITGTFLGMLVGFLVDYFGPDGCAGTRSGTCTAPYSPGVSLGYFLVLGALAGLGVAATVVVALDRILDRR